MWPFNPPSKRHQRFDVVGLGEACIDYFCVVSAMPAAGGKIRAQRVEAQGGGQVATAMVACRRLGLRAKFLGKVGDDAPGRQSLDELAHEGVDITDVRIAAGQATAAAVLVIDARSGERTALCYQDPTLALRPDELRPEQITDACLLHVDATSAAASLQAARWARAAGIPVCLDVDEVAPGVRELLALGDLCVMAQGLPEALSGERDPGRALRALRRSHPHAFLCVTLGPRGCLGLSGEDLICSPGFPVSAVDTTACGDVFRAALIHAVLRGLDVTAALRFANAAAALNTRALGGRPGIPTLSEVESFLSAHPST